PCRKGSKGETQKRKSQRRKKESQRTLPDEEEEAPVHDGVARYGL
ncbi:hypothetical protein CCACVL1_06796, partial [Corchorus capsularis]